LQKTRRRCGRATRRTRHFGLQRRPATSPSVDPRYFVRRFRLYDEDEYLRAILDYQSRAAAHAAGVSHHRDDVRTSDRSVARYLRRRRRFGSTMSQGVPLTEESRADDPEIDRDNGDSTHEIADNIAYKRLAIVNVVFVGQPGAGDREWVLIDAGLPGFAGAIKH